MVQGELFDAKNTAIDMNSGDVFAKDVSGAKSFRYVGNLQGHKGDWVEYEIFADKAGEYLLGYSVARDDKFTYTAPGNIYLDGEKVASGFSYTGTGSAGSGSPNTLTFDFRPMVILFATEASFHCWPGIFYNGIEVGKSCVINDSFFIYVTWQGHSVSWYSRDNNEEFQMNASNRTYFYVALGYDDSEA